MNSRSQLLWGGSVAVLAIAASSASALGASGTKKDVGVDPARVRAIAAMLPEQPRGLGRPIGDRAAWEAVAAEPVYRTALKEAEKLLAEPMPETTDDLYLEFSRTGNRTKWQDVNIKRHVRLDQSALAECLENKGRFLPVFKAALQSISKDRTWVMPAHDRSLANFKGEAKEIDLWSSRIAWTLATADWLLGDRLDSSTRQLIREQVRQRVLDPFREMVEGRRPRNWWLTGSNNWNAVCLAGVTGAALAVIEPREERALYVAAAEKLSRNFVAGIPADGYCTEGVGYWNYGFGHYVLLAETVLQATGGRIDLLQGEHVRKIAMYGLEVEISPGIYPSFSDCSVNARAGDRLLGYIARRWGLTLPERLRQARTRGVDLLFQEALFAFAKDLAETRPSPADWPGPGLRTWFDQSGVLVGRPGSHADCRLAAAMKGGHNAEEHNHNDVGSYIVVVDGQAVLVDPGAEVYTARTFSSQRYDSKVINSFGHPVPMVAGQLQRTGRDAQARVLRTDFTDGTDTLVLDLRAPYSVTDLEKLERTFTYSRVTDGSLTISDEVVFKTPQGFGTALVTFGRWQRLDANRLLIQDGQAAVEVAINVEGGEIDVRGEEIHEDLGAKRTPTRIGVDYRKPIERGRITLTVKPAKAGGPAAR